MGELNNLGFGIALSALACGFLLTELIFRGLLTRLLWRETMLLFTRLDHVALLLARRIVPPRFALLGTCQKRGVCCRQIVGNPPAFIKRGRLLRVFVAYHRVFHRFSVVARGPDDEVIFACGYLGSDGRCTIHRRRPFLCRNYPLIPWFEPPRLLPGCGFRIIPREAMRMTSRASLPILNAQVAVHHPSPPRSHGLETVRSARRESFSGGLQGHAPEELEEHFEQFDDSHQHSGNNG